MQLKDLEQDTSEFKLELGAVTNELEKLSEMQDAFKKETMDKHAQMQAKIHTLLAK